MFIDRFMMGSKISELIPGEVMISDKLDTVCSQYTSACQVLPFVFLGCGNQRWSVMKTCVICMYYQYPDTHLVLLFNVLTISVVFSEIAPETTAAKDDER